METNFGQSPPPVGEQPVDEARQSLIGHIGNLLRSGYEAIPRNIRMGIAIGATAFAGAQATELAFNAEPVAGESNTPARVSTPEAGVSAEANQSLGTALNSRSLKPPKILDKIHNALQSFAIDTLATHKGGDNICYLRGLIPHVPKYPKCKHMYTTLTSAFLTPDSGGFRTKCDNPASVTYHFYDIYTYGQTFHTCGPGPNPGGLGGEQSTTPGVFQMKLNNLGKNVIQKSVGLDYQETTTKVSGNRKKITANYQCPAPETDPNQPGSAAVQPAGVAKIIIRRNHSPTVAVC